MRRLLIGLFICFICGSSPVMAVLTSGSVTIKLSGGTYSSWAAFWDDLGNLTGNITCTVDASAFTEAAAPAAVSDSLGGYTLHVLPASFPTTTDASTGARFTCNYTDTIFDIQMEGAGDVIVEGMVFSEGTSTPVFGLYINSIDTAFNLTLRRNILKGITYAVYLNDATMDSGVKIYNNIIYDGTICIIISTAAPNAIVANNTVHNADNNIRCNNLDINIKNNISYAGVTLCFETIGTATNGYNNADSDSTGEDADWGGTGTNNVPGIGDPFNNLATDDFTITAEGDVGTAGLDLSGNFTDDFFGTTRVNWTIGACEFASAGWSGKADGISSPAKADGIEAPAKIDGI